MNSFELIELFSWLRHMQTSFRKQPVLRLLPELVCQLAAASSTTGPVHTLRSPAPVQRIQDTRAPGGRLQVQRWDHDKAWGELSLVKELPLSFKLKSVLFERAGSNCQACQGSHCGRRSIQVLGQFSKEKLLDPKYVDWTITWIWETFIEAEEKE